jgi:CRP-like cAMP-binding protein
MSQFWQLEEVDLFDMLCPHKFAEFRATHTFTSFRKQEFIYMQGAEADAFYLISEGRIKIGYYTPEGDEVVKAVLGPGELFGEMALTGQDRHDEFAMAAETPTVVCPMDMRMLDELLEHDKSLSVKIWKWMGLRIRRLERRIEQLVYKDVRTRLVEFVRDMALEYGVRRQGAIHIRHPFTQQNIADLIGASRPTVNALLNELIRDGWMEVQRGRFVLLKPDCFQLSA